METFKSLEIIKPSSLAVQNFIEELNRNKIIFESVESIEDRSDRNLPEQFKHLEMKRAGILFKNGMYLSVIIGGGSYGGDMGLFEIMICRNEKKIELPEWANDLEENPIGFLTEVKVINYIEKVGELK